MSRPVYCLRPEAVQTEGGGWDLGLARVEDASFLGTHWRIRLAPEAAPDLRLVAHLPPDAAPSSVLRISVDPADLSVFPEEIP